MIFCVNLRYLEILNYCCFGIFHFLNFFSLQFEFRNLIVIQSEWLKFWNYSMGFVINRLNFILQDLLNALFITEDNWFILEVQKPMNLLLLNDFFYFLFLLFLSLIKIKFKEIKMIYFWYVWSISSAKYLYWDICIESFKFSNYQKFNEFKYLNI